jgi:hypothetical protein
MKNTGIYLNAADKNKIISWIKVLFLPSLTVLFLRDKSKKQSRENQFTPFWHSLLSLLQRVMGIYAPFRKKYGNPQKVCKSRKVV